MASLVAAVQTQSHPIDIIPSLHCSREQETGSFAEPDTQSTSLQDDSSGYNLILSWCLNLVIQKGSLPFRITNLIDFPSLHELIRHSHLSSLFLLT
jgi:hypothetical protein